MRLRSFTIVVLLAAVTLSVSGCRKKKPPVPPPQAQAPTIETPAPQPEIAPAACSPEHRNSNYDHNDASGAGIEAEKAGREETVGWSPRCEQSRVCTNSGYEWNQPSAAIPST